MIIIDTLIGFLKDFGNNVFPLMFSMIFFCGLSYTLGWWRGYDSGHRAGYEDGRTYGYNFRELELQQERVRIMRQEEKQGAGHAEDGQASTWNYGHPDMPGMYIVKIRKATNPPAYLMQTETDFWDGHEWYFWGDKIIKWMPHPADQKEGKQDETPEAEKT